MKTKHIRQGTTLRVGLIILGAGRAGRKVKTRATVLTSAILIEELKGFHVEEYLHSFDYLDVVGSH